jgi:hypothetical protein
MEDSSDQILPTDTDGRYFYKHFSNEVVAFYFQSTVHKDYFLSVSSGSAELKKSANPDTDDDLHFHLRPVLVHQ